MSQPVRIGLTGGIGSGKSTVARLLAALNATVIDTDALARQLCEADGAAVPAIRHAFGDDVIDNSGALDRAQMRALAFSDATVKNTLESILHPLIGAEAERLASSALTRVVVFDVPLLVESNRWRGLVDRVLVIDCREQTQIARVSVRPGWDAAMAQSVIQRQANRDHRRASADAVIYNDNLTLDALGQEVRSLWALWASG